MGAVLDPDMEMEMEKIQTSVGGRWGRLLAAASSIPNLNNCQPHPSTRWVGDEAVPRRSRRWVYRIIDERRVLIAVLLPGSVD